MAHNSKSKIKILYVLKILQEETDAEQGLSMAQIIERLAEYGITAERKSIYDDIKTLREFDIDVRAYRRSPVEYGIDRRDFSLGELMLMIDAIQSCKAITDHQAKLLITNIKQLANNREQVLLDRRIHVAGRIKAKSESVFSVVDVVHDAIRMRCKLEFAYRKIGIDGKPYETRQGKKHVVTPVGIAYEDGFYYMSAWDEQHGDMTEYRLDRMVKVRVLPEEHATCNDQITHYAFDESKAVMFGRFKGEEVPVTLAIDPGKVGIVVDRFGKAATFLPNDGSEARAQVRICKSDQFFGWVASMGRAVRIAAPESLVEEYKAYLRFLLDDC